MRYALISDIHGNLPALEAVLADIAARGNVGATYHLGDLVGYGAWPNEVVGLLRERAIAGIAGNYDSTVGSGYPHCGCRTDNEREEQISQLGYAWTVRSASADTKTWLASLPFRIDVRPLGGHVAGPLVTLVHGTPLNNLTYWTQDRTDDFCRKMAGIAGLKAGDVIAFGHTHRPWHRVVDDVHFVNTGSVGRPKDGDWRAGYVVLDIGGEVPPSVEIVRVEYDVERAARGVTDAGLPHELAEHLRRGGAAAAGA